MAKLFQPIRFWMARFTCRKSSASSSSSCPSRPSSGLQPATIRWRAFVRRPSGRPASTKRTSATAALRSPVPCARRPRSRLGIPARLRRSGGRHRFRQASSPPVQARQFAATFPVSSPPRVHPCPENGASQNFSARSIGVNRSGFVPSPIRITPLLVATTTNCKEKQPPPEIPGSGRCRSTFQEVFSI